MSDKNTMTSETEAMRDILDTAASIAVECKELAVRCDKHGPEFARLARGMMQVWMAVRVDALAANIENNYPMGTKFLMNGGKERAPSKILTVKKSIASAFGGDE